MKMIWCFGEEIIKMNGEEFIKIKHSFYTYSIVSILNFVLSI